MNVVIDASALAGYLMWPASAIDIAAVIESGESRLHAPACLDPEVLHTANKERRGGKIDQRGFELVAAHLALATIERHDMPALTARAAELCVAFSAYDAFYVALAEQLEDAWLLTRDARMARAVKASVPSVRLLP